MIDDIKELVGVGKKVREAIEGADDVKNKMRTRMADYTSVLEKLQDEGPCAMLDHELKRLRELFGKIRELHAEHTAGPEDGKLARIAKSVNRGTQHASIEEALDEIDREVFRQFTAIAAKSSINSAAVKRMLADLRPELRRNSVVNRNFIGGVFGAVLVVFVAMMLSQRKYFRSLRLPTLPDMCAVPVGALSLPRSYVERAVFQEAVDDLIKPETALAPYKIVGMGGGGKTVLTSAIVRNSSVREHFRGGIFWMRVGRGAKDNLLPLLQSLAREMGATPTDAPHGVPHVFDNLEQVKLHVTTVASTGTSPRLVVLDDVWEREVVDALLPLKLKVLVTTRDRSVVGVPGGCLELGDMTEDEALELLLKTSSAVGQPGNDVRILLTKVVAFCGSLPLALAIAGSMPVVKGKGLNAGAWEELIKLFEDVAEKMDALGEQRTSLSFVLETSFNALAAGKKKEFLKMAVLAPGAIAPIEMLPNLWEIQDVEGARDEAEALASKCLLQDMGGGQYRVHDLLLDFVKIRIKAYDGMVEVATTLQAQYLGRLDVVEGYKNPEHGAGEQGLFFLDALWRSVENLSGDSELEIASYRASLGELESSEATADLANSYSSVGLLFNLQGKYAETEALYKRTQEILEKLLGQDHPNVATALNNRAGLLESQGKYEEAEPLYERAIVIWEAALGSDHPQVAIGLNNRAALLEKQGKHDEAMPLLERALAIRMKKLGGSHEDAVSTQKWLEAVRKKQVAPRG